MSTVKLQSSDGEAFEVEREVAVMSLTVKNMLDGMYLVPFDTPSVY